MTAHAHSWAVICSPARSLQACFAGAPAAGEAGHGGCWSPGGMAWVICDVPRIARQHRHGGAGLPAGALAVRAAGAQYAGHQRARSGARGSRCFQRRAQSDLRQYAGCDAACDYCMAHTYIQLRSRTSSPVCHPQVNSRRISRRSLLPDDDELQQVLRRWLSC
jgi:hypothetical protein